LNWKRTLLFILVLAGLTTFYFTQLYHKPAELRPSSAFSIEAAQGYVLELANREDLKKLTIDDRQNKTIISFEKNSSGAWQVISPVEFPAEPLIVDGFVSLMKLTPRLRHLSAQGLDLNEFGFDSPRMRICAGISGEEKCLLIGGKSVIGEDAYAKWENESTYFLVEPVFLKSFDKTLYMVRKKQIFNLLDDEITEIRFESSKKEIRIIREGKNWVLKKPIESQIGPQAMDSLMTELNSLYVKEFLDDQNKDKLKSKVAKADRAIRIHFRDGSEQVLIQGKEAGGRDAYYASLNQPETIFLVSHGKLNHLEESFSKLTS